MSTDLSLPLYAATRHQLEALWEVADAGKVWLLFRHDETCGPNHARAGRKVQRIAAQVRLAQACRDLRAIPTARHPSEAVLPEQLAITDPFVASREELVMLWSIWRASEGLLRRMAAYEKTGQGKANVELQLIELGRAHDTLLAMKPTRRRGLGRGEDGEANASG